MSLIPMIATRAFLYRGRALAEGETFDVAPVEALALRYTKRATFAQRRIVLTRDVTPEQPDADTAPPRRRSYRRRDLTPEP